jgi:drug/metabolite transporter (DMT)-like permease
MRPTNLATLFVAALGTAAVAWLVISNFYGDMPTLPWLPPLVMLGLAVVEAVLAVSTKASIDRREGTKPVNPLTVAWYVVLAKASALGGALFTGLYVGLLAWLLPQSGTNTHIDHDLPQAIVGLVGALGLAAAGLWLERSCRVPPTPGEDTSSDSDDHIDEERPGGERSGGRSGGG